MLIMSTQILTVLIFIISYIIFFLLFFNFFPATNTCLCQGVCDTNACSPGLQEQDGECVCPPGSYLYPDADGTVQNKVL